MTEVPPPEPGKSGEFQKIACIYPVEELLKMRHTLPFIICNLKKLNPKITSDVIKAPRDTLLDTQRNTRSSRRSCSTARIGASSSSRTPDASGDSEGSHYQVKNGSWSPEDQEDVILFRGNLALRSHEQKQMWALRKRGSLDRSSQPFPAPTGFEAQKGDNFRKFYAAVVSPTHLRVTAGGRIVRNTRGLPHPTFTWNAEKHLFEPTNQSLHCGGERQKSWLPDANLGAVDPNSRLGIAKPMDGEFFGPLLKSQCPMRSPAPIERKDIGSANAAAYDVTQEVGVEDIITPKECDTTAVQGQIKISPPNQFDMFRPFFINGQPFYPATPGIQVQSNVPAVPFNMLGNLNAPPYQSFLPTYGMIQSAPITLPGGNFAYPQSGALDSQQIGQQIPLKYSSGFHPLMIPQLHAPTGQPFTIGPLMPATSLHDEPVAMNPQLFLVVNQIQALQQQLRHLENQLENNKHQIDEQHVIHQQTHIHNQIRALQSGLGAQVFHSSLLPYEQYGSHMWNIGAAAMSGPLAPASNRGVVTANKEALETNSVFVNGSQNTAQDKKALEHTKAEVGHSIGLNSVSQGDQASAPLLQKSRKRLSAAAAMAPEFQPRSQMIIENQSFTMNTELPMTTVGGDTAMYRHNGQQKEIETPLLPNVTNWSTPGRWAKFNLTHDLAAMSIGPTTHQLKKGNALARPSTHFQAPVPLRASATNGQEISPTSRGADPYLMGYPPPGMSAHTVKSADMVYSRDLTREELQARQIYWGKAPQALSKGLPKFDGKNFYAPSPEKASVFPEEHQHHRDILSCRGSNSSSRIPELDSPNNARSMVKSPTQQRPEDSQDRLRSTDSVEQIIYEMPADKPRPAPEKESASLDSWGMAKEDEEDSFNRPADLTASFNARVANFSGFDSIKLESPISRRENSRSTTSTFLQNMLKSTPLTAMAAPTDALSSTMAHGYLPQYGGFAAASLAPSANHVRLSSVAFKNGNAGHSGRHVSGRAENQPFPRNLPDRDSHNATGNLKKLKGKEKEIVEHGFDPSKEGVGPVYGGSDW